MIVHIITGLGRGGAERSLFQLIAQDPNPSATQVISLTDGGIYGERLRAIGVQVVCMDMRPGRISLAKWWRLVRLLRRVRPVIVQTWMYHADLVGGLAAAALGIPVIWGIRHSDLSWKGNKFATLMVAKTCAVLSRWVPARAISCSSKAVDAHRTFGYAVQFDVVPNGVDEEVWKPRPDLRAELRAELGLDESMVVFAHAGREHPLKGHSTLADAFSRVADIMPNARLLLCGDGFGSGSRYLQSLPFKSAARAAVIALGPRDDLYRLWNAADIFVLSSTSEGFPNVLAEAMASGLPCVSTDAGDASKIIGGTGEVVAVSDSRALSAAMLSLAELSGHERYMRGREARQRVLERFTVKRMADGFQSAWAEVLSKGST